MGEAKRRKQLDPNFGKPRLFLSKSPITEKHMIYLEAKDQIEGISPHYRKEDALYGLSQCQKCLDSFPNSHWDQPFPIALQAFINRLNAKFNYSDDDEILGVLNPQTEIVDASCKTTQQAMADVNIDTIRAIGEKLFTATPYWHPDAPTAPASPETPPSPDSEEPS